MKSMAKRFANVMRAGQLYAYALPGVQRTQVVLEQNKESPEPITQIASPRTIVQREVPSNPDNQRYLDNKQLNDFNKRKQLLEEIENQMYDKNRVAELGPDLAALHFFTYREAAVKINNQSEWILGNLSQLAQDLPRTFLEGVHVEAIDCAPFKRGGIRYEGLQYLDGLKHLRWLSLRNQRYIDEWCLDRIAGTVGSNLQYLDISSCDLNLGCVYALNKLYALQVLVIKYPYDDNNVRTALCHFESTSPNLIIKVEKRFRLAPQITLKSLQDTEKKSFSEPKLSSFHDKKGNDCERGEGVV